MRSDAAIPIAARRSQNAIRLWVALGVLAYLALPWYALQDSSWYRMLAQTFGTGEGANGLLQATVLGRRWLLAGLFGLALCAIGAFALRPGRAQGRWLLAGGAIGFVALALAGFLIGARGRRVALLDARFGELAVG